MKKKTRQDSEWYFGYLWYEKIIMLLIMIFFAIGAGNLVDQFTPKPTIVYIQK